MNRKQLEATIKYYQDLVNLWEVGLSKNDRAELAKAEAELKELKKYESKDRQTRPPIQ